MSSAIGAFVVGLFVGISVGAIGAAAIIEGGKEL